MKKRTTLALLFSIALAPCLLAARQGTVADTWSEEAHWRTPDDDYGVAGHATLLPDGRVLFIGYKRDTANPTAQSETAKSNFTMVPTPSFAAVPANQPVIELDTPLDIDDVLVGQTLMTDYMFCAGHALTADGDFFTAGGTRSTIDLTTSFLTVEGMGYATLYDGVAWNRVAQDMAVVSHLGHPARWYPTVTRLPDGRMLVTGGFDSLLPVGNPNLSVEVFDPTMGTWEILSGYGTAPLDIFNEDYTHPVVLPEPIGGFDLLMFGRYGRPVLFSLDGPTRWMLSSNLRPQTLPGPFPNTGATSALLPLRLRDGEWGYSNGSMIFAGGAHDSVHESAVDVYDPHADAWHPRRDMGVGRHHPTGILLPDGRFVVLSGHNDHADADLRRATYVDPAAGFSIAYGTAFEEEIRGYHNIALLLPDGRVLVGGGQDAVTGVAPEKSTFRYLYPSYMSADRPEILSAPSEIRYGQPFQITATRKPVEAVLMGLGSMTHSFDFSQRYVQLERTKYSRLDPRSISVRGPASARVAPPGHYMLFVLDKHRVPSVASIVRVR